MITEQDLKEAIAECEGERSPGANTCLKLASFYTIRDHLFPAMAKETLPEPVRGYSFAPAHTPTYESETEFGKIVDGKSTAEVLAVVDELMSTLAVLNPRLYAGVLQKIADL